MNPSCAIKSLKSVFLLSSMLAPWQKAATAEEPPPTDAEKNHLAAAEKHMRRLELRRVDDGQLIELIDRPFLSFGDSARVYNSGTFWGWGTKGRPVAFVELFQAGNQTDEWHHAVTLSSSQKVALRAGNVDRWTPPQDDPKILTVTDAPSPVPTASARSRQLKDIARRFSAHEFWEPNNSRYELRLLVQPVHRYSDPAAGIEDGAVFIVAHGTNPELVLLVEARNAKSEGARWQYSLMRSSHAEIHVELDGKEVWTCPRAYRPTTLGPTTAYESFRLPVQTEEAP